MKYIRKVDQKPVDVVRFIGEASMEDMMNISTNGHALLSQMAVGKEDDKDTEICAFLGIGGVLMAVKKDDYVVSHGKSIYVIDFIKLKTEYKAVRN